MPTYANSSNLNSPGDAQEPPEIAGIRFGPRLAAVLYVLLILSAAFALWSRRFPVAKEGPLSSWAPWIFLVFAAVFAVYRFSLVRLGRYPAFKAFFQVGAAVLFFTLLLRGGNVSYEVHSESLEALLSDSNPKVRALAAEVARQRPDGKRYIRLLVERLDDKQPWVRQRAHESLVSLTGEDLGSPEEPGGAKAWRDKYP